MARQTSIEDAPARAIAGQVTGSGPRSTPSKVAEGPLESGQPVKRGTGDRQCLPMEDGDTLSAANFLGFVVASTSRPSEYSSPIPATHSVPVMETGYMFVLLTGPAAAGESVLVGTSTATLGQIQGTAAADLDAAPGCRFEESGVSGEYVKIKINRS